MKITGILLSKDTLVVEVSKHVNYNHDDNNEALSEGLIDFNAVVEVQGNSQILSNTAGTVRTLNRNLLNKLQARSKGNQDSSDVVNSSIPDDTPIIKLSTAEDHLPRFQACVNDEFGTSPAYGAALRQVCDDLIIVGNEVGAHLADTSELISSLREFNKATDELSEKTHSSLEETRTKFQKLKELLSGQSFLTYIIGGLAFTGGIAGFVWLYKRYFNDDINMISAPSVSNVDFSTGAIPQDIVKLGYNAIEKTVTETTKFSVG